MFLLIKSEYFAAVTVVLFTTILATGLASAIYGKTNTTGGNTTAVIASTTNWGDGGDNDDNNDNEDDGEDEENEGEGCGPNQPIWTVFFTQNLRITILD